MSDSLYRLIYVSRNRMPDGAEFDAGIERILEVSRANNSANGITGVLMFNSGCFSQVLEGQRNQIEETYERILQDDRHEQTQILLFDTIIERGFECWSMAYVGHDTQSLDIFASIGASTGFEPTRLEGERLYDVMTQHLLEAEQSRSRQRAA